IYFSPVSPYGSTFYMQFRYRMNSVMSYPASGFKFREYADPQVVVTTAAANSTRITIRGDFPAIFTSAIIGKKVFLSGEDAHSIAGIYTLIGVIDSRNATVDRSPSPNAAATSGFTAQLDGSLGQWTGTAWTNLATNMGGTKQI